MTASLHSLCRSSTSTGHFIFFSSPKRIGRREREKEREVYGKVANCVEVGISFFFFLSMKRRKLFARRRGGGRGNGGEGRKADKRGNRGSKIDFYFRTWRGRRPGRLQETCSIFKFFVHTAQHGRDSGWVVMGEGEGGLSCYAGPGAISHLV